MEVKTAKLRKRVARSANDNAYPKADALSESIVEQLSDPRVAMLADEAIRAYSFGFRCARKMRTGEYSVAEVVAEANWHMAVLDGRLNLTREQWFWLLRLIYIGAGLRQQVDKADQLFKDHVFGDLPFAKPKHADLKLV